jgi:hypothetical protein
MNGGLHILRNSERAKAMSGGSKRLPAKVLAANRRLGNQRSRQELNALLLADLVEAWEYYGVQALKAMAQDDPSRFVSAYTALLPKHVNVDVTENMNEEQLVGRIRELAATLGLEADLSLLTPPRAGETPH